MTDGDNQTGAYLWFYFVPDEKYINKPLRDLREREFKAGRYNPSERFPRFPIDVNHIPGCQHASIPAAAREILCCGRKPLA